MKKWIKNYIILLCRRDFTVKKLNKIHYTSLFIFVFLYVLFGFHWKVNGAFSFSLLGVNHWTWWILVISQNSITLFGIYFKKYLRETITEYIKNLQKEKSIVVGYKDDVLSQGTVYKVKEYDYFRAEDDMFNGYHLGQFSVSDLEGKIFKLVSNQKNRKNKLEKLKNIM